MLDPLQVLWSPAGVNLPSLRARSLVDVSDGDTPNIRMPIRMLSIDTPEVTARSERGAAKVDGEFEELVGWIEEGIAPVSRRFRDYILPKLKDRSAGTLQYEQGKAASDFYKAKVDERLRRPNGRRRNLIVRPADQPFDGYGRLLAYVAPSYSSRELKALTRRERPTFNLDLVESGWAAPFIIFPSIPGELDLPIFVETVAEAEAAGRGQYADPLSMPGYEYRMCEKLHGITKKIAGGDDLSYPDRIAWRTRYCADMRDRTLHGPEDYFDIPQAYRLWLWPDDVQRAIGMLNLVPSGMLTD